MERIYTKEQNLLQSVSDLHGTGNFPAGEKFQRVAANGSRRTLAKSADVMAQTIPYNLDSLGWMQFELLIQFLLKAELGIGLELWGGSADHGKDAYCAYELNFPSRHTTNPGPFVFQVKFIAGANAAGADFDSALMSAVTKEGALIRNRIEAGRWAQPKQYAFITNAPLTATHRRSISAVLQPILGECPIISLGAIDVCAMLDANLGIARSFPQILSLRNLFEILDQVVRNEIVQRTDAVLLEADGLSSVFIPTKAYDEAWEILDKHHFVVLEGPPEMGKTAVAWMIAAVMLAQKWQAVDCDKPEDFFGAYAPDRDQIFVADDAFGTTEYDVNRGSEWGRQLHKVIPKLDKRHWLVWTSRMHILQQALQEMSLQGVASRFPDHKEVLVKANRIEGNERALMLYRHARAANLGEDAKSIIRKHAKGIVNNQHFTPERIRRFVREALPGLQHQIAAGDLDEDALASAVTEAIENPTERMRKSYRQLDDEQRAILVAMLDCERTPAIEDVDKARARFQQPRRPIQEEINLLKEGFLQDSTVKTSYLRDGTIRPAMAVDWIHPSYRDLVIEELERDAPASEHFLQNCSWEGLQLTLSIAGGEKGQRRYPLMTNEKSWAILDKRLNALLAETSQPYQIREILQAVRTSLDGTTGMEEVHKKLARIIHSCCATVRARLDRQDIELNEWVLKEYYDLSMTIAPPPAMPNVYPLWKKLQTEFESILTNAEQEELNESTLSKWIEVMSVVLKTDRRLLLQDGFPDRYDELIEALCEAVTEEADASVTYPDDEVVSSEADRFHSISMHLDELVSLFPHLEDALRRASRDAYHRHTSLRERVRTSRDTEEPSWAKQRSATSAPAIDLEQLFSDL